MPVKDPVLLVVIGVIALQLIAFIRTGFRIRTYRRIIPRAAALKATRIRVPEGDLVRLSAQELFAQLDQYRNAPSSGGDAYIDGLLAEPPGVSDTRYTEIVIIEHTGQSNAILREILSATNNYLLRNSGAASDFHLIKDIVDRNTQAAEEDINLSLGIPLYLGLLGTMIGIVIGLFSMPDLSLAQDAKANDQLLNNGIALLIDGVKVAMIASFSGLFLTILNSGWIFKGSRRLVEARKNGFFTFIQDRLLPIINQGLAATLGSLQRNLRTFNDRLATNLHGLESIFRSNAQAIAAQRALLEALERTKMAELAMYNVKVLQQLDLSVVHLNTFNDYLGDVNRLAENAKGLVEGTNRWLERTEEVGVIAAAIRSRLEENKELMAFLTTHFADLQEHKAHTDQAVAEVGHGIKEIFLELKEHIRRSSAEVKEFTVQEMDALTKALAGSKTDFANLAYLKELNADLSKFKDSAAVHGEQIKQRLDALNERMGMAAELLDRLERQRLLNRLGRLFRKNGKTA